VFSSLNNYEYLIQKADSPVFISFTAAQSHDSSASLCTTQPAQFRVAVSITNLRLLVEMLNFPVIEFWRTESGWVGGWNAGTRDQIETKKNFFLDAMILNFLPDLPFRGNQPLKSVDA